MPNEVKTSRSNKGSVTARRILNIVFIILASASFLNIYCVLNSYRKLNEISMQCAFSAAYEKNAGAAASAVQKIIERQKQIPFLKQPIISEIVYFGGATADSQNKNSSAFAIVKTTACAGVPVPQLFQVLANSRKVVNLSESNTINIEALQSAPFIPMFDSAPKENGRNSI